MPRRGGDLRVFLAATDLQHLDPQRVATSEGGALLTSFVFRTLTVHTLSDGPEAGTILPDLALDTGTTPDDGRTWSFGLRTGIVFDNGLPFDCASVKNGVARNFARELGNDGTGAVSVLDIPLDGDGASTYQGPYTGTTLPDGRPSPGAVAFDAAVECSADGSTITFHLREAMGNFNELTALPAFAPVPPAADIGASYDDRPLGTGPYRVDRFTPGRSVTLVRNYRWQSSDDPHRPAWPDTVDVELSDDVDGVASTLAESVRTNGEASGFESLGPGEISPVAAAATGLGPSLPASTYHALLADGLDAAAVVDGYDGWERHLAINTQKVENLDARRAIQAAIDRAGYRDALVGVDGGDLSDGVIAPTLGLDSRPTELWQNLAGRYVGDHGDPALARSLLASVGPLPTLTLNYPQTAADDAAARVLIDSLGRAGISVEPRPVPAEQYVATVENADLEGDLVIVDYRPVIPSGVTVVSDLFGIDGASNFSRSGSDSLERELDSARRLQDRARQALEASRLATAAVDNALVVPLLDYRQFRLAGPRVHGAYLWDPYSSWAYADAWVEPAGS